MPSTLIEVRQEYNPQAEIAILDAVHAALVAAFSIPENDKHLRLVVHEPHRFAVPSSLSSPEVYTLITVDCFAGRSTDAKRALYREIVSRLAPLGIPDNHITVIVRDIDTTNWGVRGGQAACDLDVGFEIRV